MSKALANPKIFGAACLLFVGATLFNVTAKASTAEQGLGLPSVTSALSAPVLGIGPTLPPSPWDDDSPVAVSSKL